MAGGVAALMAQRAAKEGRRQQMAFNAAQARAQQQWQQQQAEAARSDKWKRFGMGFLADLAKGLIGEYMPSRIAARSAAEEQQRLAREQAARAGKADLRAGVRSAQDTARFLATAGLTDAMTRATPTEMGLEYKEAPPTVSEEAPAPSPFFPPPGPPAQASTPQPRTPRPGIRLRPLGPPPSTPAPQPWEDGQGTPVPNPPRQPVTPAPMPVPRGIALPPSRGPQVEPRAAEEARALIRAREPDVSGPRGPAAPYGMKRGRVDIERLKTPAGTAGVPGMTVQQLAREIARKKEADEKKAADLRAKERLETRKIRVESDVFRAKGDRRNLLRKKKMLRDEPTGKGGYHHEWLRDPADPPARAKSRRKRQDTGTTNERAALYKRTMSPKNRRARNALKDTLNEMVANSANYNLGDKTVKYHFINNTPEYQAAHALAAKAAGKQAATVSGAIPRAETKHRLTLIRDTVEFGRKLTMAELKSMSKKELARYKANLGLALTTATAAEKKELKAAKDLADLEQSRRGTRSVTVDAKGKRKVTRKRAVVSDADMQRAHKALEDANKASGAAREKAKGAVEEEPKGEGFWDKAKKVVDKLGGAKPKAKKKWTPGEAKREANRLYGAGTKEARAHYDKLMGAK